MHRPTPLATPRRSAPAWPRVLRAAVFTALCVAVSASVHACTSRAQVPAGTAATAAAAVFLLVLPQAGAARSYLRIAATAAPVQLVLAAWFTAGQVGCAEPPGGDPAPVDRLAVFRETLLCGTGPFGAHPALPRLHGTGPLLMAAGHVAVALAAAWWLRCGEAAAGRVLRGLAGVALRAAAAALAACAGARVGAGEEQDGGVPRRGLPGPPPVTSAERALLHAVIRRGPPVTAAAAR